MALHDVFLYVGPGQPTTVGRAPRGGLGGLQEGGAPEQGPYDAILVNGGVEQVSPAILDQLKDGGRIAALFLEGALGVVRIGHRIGGHVNWRYGFNALAPLLPDFRRERGFAL